MPRRNKQLRFQDGKDPRAKAKVQHGKGGKRARDWHRSTAAGRQVAAMPDLPDVGSGADPTSGAPSPIRHTGRGYRGPETR